MPKRIQTILTVAVLLLTFVTGTSARTPVEVSAARGEAMEVRKENMEERQENREDRRGALAELHSKRLENRFTFYSKRLSNLIERIQVRLNTLKESGKNTDKPQQTLDLAKAELQKANTAKETAIRLFQSISKVERDDKKAEIEKAQAAAVEARRLFLSAQKLIRQAVSEMKAL
jgi:signal recognition particle GTPase